MAVDGIHVNIGKLFRKTSIVATFDNFVEVRKKASGKIETIILDLPFIYQISKKSRVRSSAKVKMSLLEKFFWVQFKKDSRIYYEESFIIDWYTAVDFSQSSFIKSGGYTSLLQPWVPPSKQFF